MRPKRKLVDDICLANLLALIREPQPDLCHFDESKPGSFVAELADQLEAFGCWGPIVVRRHHPDRPRFDSRDANEPKRFRGVIKK